MAFLSTKTRQFTYFDEKLGESLWRGKDVLDFGGNVGNLLRDPNSTVEAGRYWCIDVDEEALAVGRARYPEARWLHYDRYCFFFNPRGTPRLRLPPIEQRFDYVLAYSVFTNTPTPDMLDLVAQLGALLKPGGALAFTFIDPRHRSWPDEPGMREWDNFRWRLEKVRREENPEVDIASLAERARAARRQCILVNGRDLYLDTDEIAPCEPERQRTCYVFHTEEYVRSLFPGSTVLPPACGEMQHCCVVRRG